MKFKICTERFHINEKLFVANFVLSKTDGLTMFALSYFGVSYQFKKQRTETARRNIFQLKNHYHIHKVLNIMFNIFLHYTTYVSN